MPPGTGDQGGEFDEAHQLADEVFHVSTQERLSLAMWARILRGRTLAKRTSGAEGIDDIREGLKGTQSIGTEMFRPYWLNLLADALAEAGEPDPVLEMAERAANLSAKCRMTWCDREHFRLLGEPTLRVGGGGDKAEELLRRGLLVAQSAGAKGWELRAATSLAGFWRNQGKRREAFDLLAPVYGWFTEGFDTADLKEAKALLEELK